MCNKAINMVSTSFIKTVYPIPQKPKDYTFYYKSLFMLKLWTNFSFFTIPSLCVLHNMVGWETRFCSQVLNS